MKPEQTKKCLWPNVKGLRMIFANPSRFRFFNPEPN